jgi:hypothetical protein
MENLAMGLCGIFSQPISVQFLEKEEIKKNKKNK